MALQGHSLSNNTQQLKDSPPFDIAIVGGGIAGLTLALALHRHAPHIPYTIYEAAVSFGEIGAGVGFSPNAVHAMKLISPELEAAFERLRTPNGSPEKYDVWYDFFCGMDGPDGSSVREGKLVGVVSAGDARGGCHRAHFLDELVKLLPQGRAQFGKRLKSIEQAEERGLVLIFADGSTATHGAVLGCDGIKSKARQLILDEHHPAAKAVFTKKYCYRGLIPMEEAVEALGDMSARNGQMYLGYHRHLITFPVAKGAIMNVVAFSSMETWNSDDWVIPGKKEDMYEDFKDFGEKVQIILSHMRKPDVWALFNHLPIDSYYKGRICLIGDAAHASTPHQGAGAGMAVEDAYVMSMILKDVTTVEGLEVAFAAFDKVRRPRTQKLVTTSREAGELLQFELEGVGDDLDRIYQNLSIRQHWIWYHMVENDVMEVQKLR